MIELMYLASSSKCFLDILWLLLINYTAIIQKGDFLVNHKKTLHRAGFFSKRVDYFFAGAGAAGAAAGAAGLAASFFGSSFFAGADCATADKANADATIANNAFMVFPFESKLMTRESCHLLI
jgi:hypothetical protein